MQGLMPQAVISSGRSLLILVMATLMIGVSLICYAGMTIFAPVLLILAIGVYAYRKLLAKDSSQRYIHRSLAQGLQCSAGNACHTLPILLSALEDQVGAQRARKMLQAIARLLPELCKTSPANGSVSFTQEYRRGGTLYLRVEPVASTWTVQIDTPSGEKNDPLVLGRIEMHWIPGSYDQLIANSDNVITLRRWQAGIF